tara:strand:+ start:462 stop:1226 length:765 start_codon:yes stop_codon:yes gene_type:complete
MKIAGIQHDIIWENPEANFEALRPLIQEAAASGAELIALPELFSTGFSMNTGLIAEDVDGPSTLFLSELSRITGVPICGSAPILNSEGVLPENCLLVVKPDGSIDRYAKKHLFSFAEEHNHYTAGSSNLTIRIGDLRISFFICFDLRFAPEFWCLAEETDLYVVVANWPESRRDHWSSLLRARAIENQAYVLGVNRVGDGDGISHSGDSCLVNPLGENVVAAKQHSSEIFMGDVDQAVVCDTRSKFPFMSDRSE